MKCIKKKTDGSITRVKDEDAKKKVTLGSHFYCSKEEWKFSRKPVEVEHPVSESESSDVVAEEKVHGLKAKERRAATH